MSDSVRPHRQQPTRLLSPWDSPGKNTGAGCHFLLQCMKVKSETEVAQSCPTLATPWTAAYQAPPTMGFSRQEYWSGVPLPSPSTSLLVTYFIYSSGYEVRDKLEDLDWQILPIFLIFNWSKWKTLTKIKTLLSSSVIAKSHHWGRDCYKLN